MDEAWSFEHSVDCSVSQDFAWSFWINVSNWSLDADIESVVIDGPFVAGARGVTHSRSSGKIEWRVAEVGASDAIIEVAAPGALARFAWTFEKSGQGTRFTQRASMSGEQAPQHAAVMGPVLEAGMPAGMQKLCEAMETAARSRNPASAKI